MRAERRRMADALTPKQAAFLKAESPAVRESAEEQQQQWDKRKLQLRRKFELPDSQTIDLGEELPQCGYSMFRCTACHFDSLQSVVIIGPRCSASLRSKHWTRPWPPHGRLCARDEAAPATAVH